MKAQKGGRPAYRATSSEKQHRDQKRPGTYVPDDVELLRWQRFAVEVRCGVDSRSDLDALRHDLELAAWRLEQAATVLLNEDDEEQREAA